MPHIIPIKDIKNTAAISDLCHKTGEPIYVTKNGYGDMVIQSIQSFEEQKTKIELYKKLFKSDLQFKNGETKEAFQFIRELEMKYGL